MAQIATTPRPEIIKRRYHGCSGKGNYETISKLGEGTFGEVWKAMSKRNSEVYALKKILMHNEKDGFPITALREINLLKSLSHPNVLRLEEMAVERERGGTRKRAVLYMVTPYMDHDLSGLLDNPEVRFTEPQIKCYMLQLLEGLRYLHNSHILHRDMKAANLLINNRGVLQIGDFGLARHYDEPAPQPGKGNGEAHRDYTALVVTRWYRPPELLLHLRRYTPAIDMWGAGCVFGEMFKRKPILAGNSDLNQTTIIFDLVGTPTDTTMPGWTELPGYEGVKGMKPRPGNLEQQFRDQGSSAISLLRELLKLDWRKRINAADAIQHPYFQNDPKPARPEEIPVFPDSHELDRRNARQAALPPAPAGGTVGVGPNGEWTGAGPPPMWDDGKGRHRGGPRDTERPGRRVFDRGPPRRDDYDDARDHREPHTLPGQGNDLRHPLPLPPHRRPEQRDRPEQREKPEQRERRYGAGQENSNVDTYIPNYANDVASRHIRDRGAGDSRPRERDQYENRNNMRQRGGYRDPDAPPPDRKDRAKGWDRPRSRSRSPGGRNHDRERERDSYRSRRSTRVQEYGSDQLTGWKSTYALLENSLTWNDFV